MPSNIAFDHKDSKKAGSTMVAKGSKKPEVKTSKSKLKTNHEAGCVKRLYEA